MIRSIKRMKKIAVLFLLAVLCISLSPVKADYPIMSQHYAADPTAVEWNGRIYVYCSNDQENTDNSGYIMDSIVCFSTDDLKNWTDHGVVFDADDLPWYSGTAWAPCIVYNNNKFYLYFGDAYWGVGVVTSDSPTGPFTDPKGDLVVKREGLPGGTPGADSSWLFDPCVFVDDDGQPYCYFGGEGADQARVVLLDDNMIDTVGSAIPIEFPDFFEAAMTFKRNGIYYLSYADSYNDSTPSSQIAYMTSSSPTGGFVYQGVALPQPPSNFGNNNHHTFFTFQGDWYAVYHNRYQAVQDGVSTTEHRNICLDRMYFNPDGTIQQIVPTMDGLSQLKNLNPFNKVEAETISQQSGVRTEPCSEGGMNVTSISDGDWIRVRGVDFSDGSGMFYARVASSNSGGTIELRLDSLSGSVISSVDVPNTGDRQSWTTVSESVSNVSGVHDLYIRFYGGQGDDLFNFNWWQFNDVATVDVTVNIDASTRYQTIEGLGGAVCFYNGWFTAHPNKQEIFDHAFTGLNISMLRLGNWWRGTNGTDNATYEIVNAMKSRIGDRPILMTSWAPPAYLKSNGEVANGGTLIQVDGEFDYDGFADYWYNALLDYASHGIVPTWVGVQNEPDWTADYDSCRFQPTESYLDGQWTASFNLAQEAVFYKLQENMANPPKLLGPECVGLYGNAGMLRNYMNNMNPDTFYGVAHHLYGGSTDGTPDGYNQPFTTIKNTVASQFPGKPKFMTEFGDIKGLVPCANLIHNSLVVEQVSGYNHWCLMWPGDIGLVEIEFPWGSGDWVNPKGYWLNESYWSMKHYSYYVQPGFRLVQSGVNNSNVLTSAYISPDEKRLVVVYINRNTDTNAFVNMNISNYSYDQSVVFQTYGENHFVDVGPVSGSSVLLPPSSVTTVVFDHYGPIAPAGLSATAVSESQVNLSWQGSPNSQSYNIKRSTFSGGPYSVLETGITTSSFCDTRVVPGQDYYYVVSSNTSEGESSDSTEAAITTIHTYLKFNENSGTTAVDSSGNNHTGTLVNGPTWVSARYANGVNLDGNNDHVTLPQGVVNGLTECTISVWVNLDSIGNWSRIFDFGSGTNVNMFLTPRHSNSSGTVRFAITTGGAGGEQRINGTSAVPTGTWTHIAVSLDGSTGVLYVNGTEVGRNNSMSLSASSLGNSTQNYIGRSQYPDPYLDGRVDEFRIYDSVLSSSQVATLYNEQITSSVNVPSSLTAEGISGTEIALSWNSAAETINYNVKRSENQSGPYQTIASISGTSYLDSSLAEKVTYYYTVSSVNNSGESADAESVPATTLDTPPAMPVSVNAVGGDGVIEINWSANIENDLAGYNIYRCSSVDSGFELITPELVTINEYADTLVMNYQEYYYMVSAVDIGGTESDLSEVVSAIADDGKLEVLSSVDFEEDFGDWVNLTDIDSDNWRRHSGSTLTNYTGPSGGADGSAYYAYLETSPGGSNRAGNSAILESPEIAGYKRTLSFYYHMYGSNIGTLNVDIYDGSSWHESVWSLSGQQQTASQDPYTKVSLSLFDYHGPIKVRLRAVAAGGTVGDMAIDQISIYGGSLYGDFDSDNQVTITDLAEFAANWLSEDCNLDLDGDCIVNMPEFLELSNNWQDN